MLDLLGGGQQSRAPSGEAITYHTLPTLQGWIDEFTDLHAPFVSEVVVLIQDGEDGADTGLVEIRMVNASTVTTIEPEFVGSNRWVTVFDARDEPLRLDAKTVMWLSRELATVSELCSFLERKASAYEIGDGDGA